jgi:hypothetical protein
MLYAGLTGPLLGAYLPIPADDKVEAARMLNGSKLKSLWCAVYTEEELAASNAKLTKLPKNFAMNWW